jgi:hypothetical protein
VKIRDGHINLFDGLDGWTPSDEVGKHLMIHCWHGPVPVPTDQQAEFEEAAKQLGNTISVSPEPQKHGLLALLFGGRWRTSETPSA